MRGDGGLQGQHLRLFVPSDPLLQSLGQVAQFVGTDLCRNALEGVRHSFRGGPVCLFNHGGHARGKIALPGNELAQQRQVQRRPSERLTQTSGDVEASNRRQAGQGYGSRTRVADPGGRRVHDTDGARPHPVQQLGPQGFGIDRLRQMVVHPGRKAAFAIPRHGVGGHRHDRQVLQAWQLADLARGGLAVHHRHLHVHQDTIVAGLLHLSERLGPIDRQLDHKPLLLQHLGRHLLVEFVVLHQQDTRADNR